MGKWVDARRADGRMFSQWQRTEEREEMPPETSSDTCIVCGAGYSEVRGSSPERSNAGGDVVEAPRPFVRYAIEHDYHLHDAWPGWVDPKKGGGEGLPDDRTMHAPRRARRSDD